MPTGAINLGEEPSKTIFGSSRISVLGIHPYRAYQGIPTQITVTEAHNSQSQCCLGRQRSRHLEVFWLNERPGAREASEVRAPSPTACPPRVFRSFLRPLLPSACYAGYVEVALSSNFMVFPRRHYFYLFPRQGISHSDNNNSPRYFRI